MLNAGIDAAVGRLNGLAESSWMMGLPQQEAHHGHPAGRARPGLPAGGGSGLVAVTFGKATAADGPGLILPVQWEQLEPGDGFSVLLDGEITLTPSAGQTRSALTLTGFCRLPESTLAAHGHGRATVQVNEAIREFVAKVAVTVADPAAPGQEPLGPAWSWVNGSATTIDPLPPQGTSGPDDA